MNQWIRMNVGGTSGDLQILGEQDFGGWRSQWSQPYWAISSH